MTAVEVVLARHEIKEVPGPGLPPARGEGRVVRSHVNPPGDAVHSEATA